MKYVTEYLVLPFPDVQPEYWLKIELWKTGDEYRPIVYVRDGFRLTQSSLCGRRKHRKTYHIWVEDQWGIFPENCTVKGVPEEEVMGIVLEVVKCNMLKQSMSPSLAGSLHYRHENL